MSMLLSWIMAGTIPATNLQNTWWIQNKYVIENYFHRVDSQAPIVYRGWRVLWQPTAESNLTNRSDCWWMLVWYMMYLDLIISRWKDSNWKSFTYDGGWLNSTRLITLWDWKRRSDVVRWDFVYMEFPWWVKHIAVVCDDWWDYIYDLYEDDQAKCRPMPPTVMHKYSDNWFIAFMNDRWIVLDETKQVLDYFQQIKNEINSTGDKQDQLMSGDNTVLSGNVVNHSIINVVYDRIKNVI